MRTLGSCVFPEDRSLPDLMAGVEISLPLFAMNTAAQKGRLCGGLNFRISWKPYLPHRAPSGALRRGDLKKMSLIL
jgi:hypothetical protein